MEFELTNEQRKYFGLAPLDKKWDKFEMKKNIWIFFEGNTLKKMIQIGQRFNYSEEDYHLETNKRKTLLPKTSKGKEKPLTPSNIEAFKPINFSFRVFFKRDQFDASISIFNPTTKKKITPQCDKNMKSFSELSNEIKLFMKSSSPEYLQEIKNLKKAKRVHIKYKPGDIFSFSLSPAMYGFGKILFPLKILRDKKMFAPSHYFSYLIGVPLLVRIFAYQSSTQNVDIKLLQQQRLLPAFFMADNEIFWANYPIIASSELKKEDLDFPISYNIKTNTFCWGLGMISNTASLKTPINPTTLGMMLRNYSVSFGASPNLLEKYLQGDEPYYDYDLNHSQNKKLRQEVFKAAGLSPEISYDEFCKIMKIPNGEEFIKVLGNP